MKTLLTILIASLGLSGVAHADIIQCDFTEPFITMKYDTSTAKMEVSNFDETTNYDNVELEINGINKMSLVWDNGTGRINTINMTIDYQGSNGMSDHLYPYSAQYFANKSVVMPLYGGCHSKNLKLIMPEGGGF